MSGAFTYRGDQREPFDPDMVGRELAGCLLCGRPVVLIGIFTPNNDEGRAAVLRLRTHPLRPRSDAGLAYGLCRGHARDTDRAATQVEDAIVAMTQRVVLQ